MNDRSTRACVFVGDRLLLAEGETELPTMQRARRWIDGDAIKAGDPEWFHVAAPSGTAGTAVSLPESWAPPAGVTPTGLRAVLPLLPEPSLSLAMTAAHLARWRRTSRHCGVCGARNRPARVHRAMQCPSCGHLAFPKISPAVIVQVTRSSKTRGREILLGRSRRHPRASYSVLAGFVDPGESLEDAVRREIHEEAGIRIADVRYFGSQPWPFPDSLMVGFTAKWAEGHLVSQDDELEDVGWFSADAMPPVPPSYSIARALIDDFVRGQGVDPATVPTWKRGRRRS